MYSFKRIKLFSKTRILLSVVLGVGVSVIIGGTIYDELSQEEGNSREEIKNVEIQINEIVSEIKDIVSKGTLGYDDAVWSKIENVGLGLCSGNMEIAEAKLFVLAPYRKSGRFSDIVATLPGVTVANGVWTVDRVDPDVLLISQRPWKVYEPWGIWAKSIGAGIGSTVLTIPAAWLVILIVSFVILIVSWVWYFFLDRIWDLSNAIQGHNDPEHAIPKKTVERKSVKENAD